MAYTILDSETGDPLPIRLIADRQPGNPLWYMFQICDPVSVRDWTYDACATPDKRYKITFQSGAVGYYAWYEVIQPGNSVHDIQVKLCHYAKVKTAAANLESARREYKRITGFHADRSATWIPIEALER